MPRALRRSQHSMKSASMGLAKDRDNPPDMLCKNDGISQ